MVAIREYLDHIRVKCYKHEREFSLSEVMFAIDPKFLRLPCGCETLTELSDRSAVILQRRDPDEAIIKLTAEFMLRITELENRISIIEKELRN